jgi:hypothetical protein
MTSSAGATQCHKDGVAGGGVCGDLQTAKGRLASVFPISLYVPNITYRLILLALIGKRIGFAYTHTAVLVHCTSMPPCLLPPAQRILGRHSHGTHGAWCCAGHISPACPVTTTISPTTCAISSPLVPVGLARCPRPCLPSSCLLGVGTAMAARAHGAFAGHISPKCPVTTAVPPAICATSSPLVPVGFALPTALPPPLPDPRPPPWAHHGPMLCAARRKNK